MEPCAGFGWQIWQFLHNGRIYHDQCWSIRLTYTLAVQLLQAWPHIDKLVEENVFVYIIFQRRFLQRSRVDSQRPSILPFVYIWNLGRHRL